MLIAQLKYVPVFDDGLTIFLTYLSGEGLINLSAGYFESELYGLLSLKFRYSKKASKVEKNHPCLDIPLLTSKNKTGDF